MAGCEPPMTTIDDAEWKVRSIHRKRRSVEPPQLEKTPLSAVAIAEIGPMAGAVGVLFSV